MIHPKYATKAPGCPPSGEWWGVAAGTVPDSTPVTRWWPHGRVTMQELILLGPQPMIGQQLVVYPGVGLKEVEDAGYGLFGIVEPRDDRRPDENGQVRVVLHAAWPR